MKRPSISAYPGDPPEADDGDPHPESEEMFYLLEKVGVAQEVIDAACAIVDELADRIEGLANKECAACERRAIDEYRRSAEDFEREFAKPGFGLDIPPEDVERLKRVAEIGRLLDPAYGKPVTGKSKLWEEMESHISALTQSGVLSK